MNQHDVVVKSGWFVSFVVEFRGAGNRHVLLILDFRNDYHLSKLTDCFMVYYNDTGITCKRIQFCNSYLVLV